MGGAVARRLLVAGHTVHGYNRTREKAQPLVDSGMLLEDSPRAVAERADVVFSMVTDTNALEAIARGPDGVLAGLSPGKYYIDMSTCSPAASRALAADVDALGAKMLDAPVSGAPTTVEQGKAAIVVGGDPDAFAAVEPVLRDIAPTVRLIGENGQALLMKIAINLSLMVQMTAFSEGLLIAEKGGIDRQVAVDAILESVAGSPVLQYRGRFVLEQPEEAWFDCRLMQKDMLLALEAGREYGVAMPTTAASNELLSAARGLGLDHRDFAIVYDVLAGMAGVRGSVA
jgi:3-hydroxyisobutyrate dehydrogenase-like beta-hydroxyacid dehydrogenase